MRYVFMYSGWFTIYFWVFEFFFLDLVLFSCVMISLHKLVMDILFDFENIRGNKKCVGADAH
jgi:hypothetical protein